MPATSSTTSSRRWRACTTTPGGPPPLPAVPAEAGGPPSPVPQVAGDRGPPPPPPGSPPPPPALQQSLDRLRGAVTMKMEEGDLRGAICLASLDVTMAEHTEDTFHALLVKHPSRPLDYSPPPSPGSSGGPDGLCPQHLKDMVASLPPDSPHSPFLSALAAFSSLIFEGRVPPTVRSDFFGARLIALNKRGGGIACFRVSEEMADLFSPLQWGFGVKGGIEAAVHAGCYYLDHLPADEAIVKLDFRNAFNSIRRDLSTAYSASSSLFWEDRKLDSSEGVQQGDPLGPLLFCITLHQFTTSLKSPLRIAYLDDITLGGSVPSLCSDISTVKEAESIGLVLNPRKFEIISDCTDPPPPLAPVAIPLPGGLPSPAAPPGMAALQQQRQNIIWQLRQVNRQITPWPSLLSVFWFKQGCLPSSYSVSCSKGRTRASSPPLPARASTTSSGLILPSSLRVSVIRRLPKASRRLAAKKLCSLLEEVVAINSSATWKNLLSFAPRFLFSPGRGGKRWSLASQINRQLESHVEPSIDPHNPRSCSLRRSPRSLDRLRGAVAMKMEEGDLRGAICLASLDVTMAEHTEDTFHALLVKHPSRPLDYSPPPSPGETSSDASLLSPNTVDGGAGLNGGISLLRQVKIDDLMTKAY
uniref:Reverse transcriptase domain-containing protein n=1 Tax=Amphimedon queenslandica TaxID=400682 RepID=A0A1X7UQU8_AMPQE